MHKETPTSPNRQIALLEQLAGLEPVNQNEVIAYLQGMADGLRLGQSSNTKTRGEVHILLPCARKRHRRACNRRTQKASHTK